MAARTKAYFEAIERIPVDDAHAARYGARLREAADRAAVLKAMIAELGAVACGCTALDPAFVYTTKGRFEADYGTPVDLDHDHAIVFLVEMDYARMQRAPLAETLLESARQYWRAAIVAKQAAAAIEDAGFHARPHYDAHYDVVLPPLAVRAGLGELGRNNILVADRYGSRVRIGAVTTDLPVAHDEGVSLGVRRFCETCRKCATSCPSHALSVGPRETVNGTRRWPTNVVRCHGWWRRGGTDCGVCMAVCPLSHRDNAFHGSVRWPIRRAPWLRRPLVWLDDVFYGRRWSPATKAPPPPADMP